MLKRNRSREALVPKREAAFDLSRFFPYRLAVLAERVSEAVSQVYSDRFNLSRSEWRVLAALGDNIEMAASDISPYSTLDKMQVSRAVVRLEEKGLIERATDVTDGRSKRLSLTNAGSALLARIVPLVVAREAYLLETISSEEKDVLEKAMAIILSRAEGLVRRG